MCKLPTGDIRHVDGAKLSDAHRSKLKDGAGSTVSEWPVVGVMVKDPATKATPATLLAAWNTR